MSGDVTAASRGEIRSPRAVFAERFAQLYTAAGNPTLRRVATLAEQRMRAAAGKNPNSPSAQRISDWKAGRNVPARFESLLPVVLTLADLTKKRGNTAPAALLDPQEWRRLWTASNSWTPADPEDIPCPYPGLQSYRRTERDSFFGRRRATEELVDLVRTVEGIVVLVGASGAGKSSLLAAGLAATLAAPPDNWGVLSITPGSRPRDTLAEALAAQEGTARLLIVDQFEELFTVCADEHERDAFLADLDRLATDHAVVLALRADFYARCLDYPVLQESLEKRSYLLGPMRIDELAAAVTGPAEHAGLELEPGLDELVITELCGLGDHEARQSYDPGALPLLSHVMAATWQHRERRKLTLGGYRKAGGVVGSVAATAEQAWSELSDAQQEAAKDLLLGLVTVAKDSRDTRRIASRPALLRRGGDPDAAAAALEVLSRARLVTLDADSVFLTHEIVLDAWPRLRTWIEENRVGYLVRQRLESDAAEWDSAGRDPELLYGGARLQTAADHAGPAAEGQVHDFLHASRSAHRRSRLRNSSTKALLALAGVILLVFGLAAYTQTRFAEQQRNERNFAAVLVEAQRLRESDPSLAAQLLMVAERMKPGDETVYTNLLGTQSWPLARSVSGHTDRISRLVRQTTGPLLASVDYANTARLWDVTDLQRPKVVTELPEEITDIAFSPDGRTMATTSLKGTRLWDIGTPEAPSPLSTLTNGQGPYYSVDFSADGRTLATADTAGITLWEVTDPRNPRRGRLLAQHLDAHLELRFSPTGRTLAAIVDVAEPNGDTWSDSVQLWEISDHENGRALGRPLPTATETIQDMAFDPSGTILAVGTGDGAILEDGGTNSGTVQLWRIGPDHADPIGRPFAVGDRALDALTFSPDGRMLAISTLDHAGLWLIADPAHPKLLPTALTTSSGVCDYGVMTIPCDGGPDEIVFDIDGRTLIAGGPDRMLRFWALPPGSVPVSVENSSRPSIDHAGRRMAIVSARNRITLLDAEAPTRWLPVGELTDVPAYAAPALSADGQTLVRSSLFDGELAVFDLSDPAAARRIADWNSMTGGGYTLAVRRDWRVGISWDDKTFQVWDLSVPTRPIPLGSPHPLDPATEFVTFSPDGSAVAMTSRERSGESYEASITLWDFTDPSAPERITTLTPGLPDAINIVRFAPDNRTLVITGNEVAQVWDIEDHTRIRPISEVITMDTLPIGTIEFSPDSTRAVITGESNRLWLWDFSDRTRPRRIGDALGTFHEDDVRPAARFLPHGNHLLLSGTSLEVWDLNVDNAIARICDVTGDLLTPEIWQRHLPDLPYAPPCD